MDGTLRAEVISTTNLGSGVVRAPDGRVIFVCGAVRGDTADIVITRKHGSYAEGRIASLVSPSEHRVAPECDVFDPEGHGCGGCTFRHVSYAHELAVKSDFIKTAMKKCGIMIEPEPFLTAGCDAVRSKVTVPVYDGASGYYAHGSHTVIPCRRCRLHDGETDDIRAALADSFIAGLHHITVRRASVGTMVILRGAHADDAADASARLTEKYPFVTSVWTEVGGKYTHISGESAICDTLAGCRFKISPDSFYQVNHAGAELLYRCAVEAAGLRGGERVADLFCGTGTIGIAAAKNADIDLIGIEINESAVRDACANADNNGVRARFLCADAATYTEDADCVFIDPPRAGCTGRLIAHLCRVLPRRIVYVSCEPSTLARDAAKLAAAGYRIESVTPVDMFPRTSHVECVTAFTM